MKQKNADWFDALHALWVRCYVETGTPPPALDVDEDLVDVPCDEVRTAVWADWRAQNGITITWRGGIAEITQPEERL